METKLFWSFTLALWLYNLTLLAIPVVSELVVGLIFLAEKA